MSKLQISSSHTTNLSKILPIMQQGWLRSHTLTSTRSVQAFIYKIQQEYLHVESRHFINLKLDASYGKVIIQNNPILDWQLLKIKAIHVTHAIICQHACVPLIHTQAPFIYSYTHRVLCTPSQCTWHTDIRVDAQTKVTSEFTIWSETSNIFIHKRKKQKTKKNLFQHSVLWSNILCLASKCYH